MKPSKEMIRGYIRTLKVYSGEREIPIEPSRKVWDHSLEYNWGYWGSGPAQLALALLLDANVPPQHVTRHHQAYKRDCVALLPEGEDFAFPRAELLEWIDLNVNRGGPQSLDRLAANLRWNLLFIRCCQVDQYTSALLSRESVVDAVEFVGERLASGGRRWVTRQRYPRAVPTARRARAGPKDSSTKSTAPGLPIVAHSA